MSVSEVLKNDQVWRVLKLSETPESLDGIMAYADLLPEKRNLTLKDQRERFFKTINQIKNLIKIGHQKAVLDEAYGQPNVAAEKKLDLTDLMKPRLMDLFGEKGFAVLIYDTVKAVGDTAKKGVAALNEKENALRNDLHGLSVKNKEFRLRVKDFTVIQAKDFFSSDKHDGALAFRLHGDLTKKTKEKRKPYYKKFGSARTFLETSAKTILMIRAINAVRSGHWHTETFVAQAARTKVEDIIPDQADTDIGAYVATKGLKTLRGLVDDSRREQVQTAFPAQKTPERRHDNTAPGAGR